MSTRKLRILHVTPYYEHAWAYGGIPRIVASLATTQAARGHAVTVCTTDACDATRRLARPRTASPGGPWHDSPAERLSVEVFPNYSNRLAYHAQFFTPRGLRPFLRSHARTFDVAHIHAHRNLPSTIAARAMLRAGVPYVVAPNGTAPRIERRQLAKTIFDSTIGRHVMPGATRLIAVSEAERAQFRALGVSDDRITVVPNPVDLSEFEPPIERGRFRRAHDLGTTPVVMYLGKLTPRKRLDVLARAFALLARPDARLMIVGNDMGYESELRVLLKSLGIESRTTFTGLLKGRDRLEALADANVVTYASKDEIFGLVPLEAILSGTPVVVADDSGCGEVIRHVGGGMVVPEGDVRSLAGAVGRVLDDQPFWTARAVTAQAAVRSFCGPEAVYEGLDGVYRTAIEQSRVAVAT